jgi:cell division protein FtsN
MAEATVKSPLIDDEMSFIQETVPQEPSPPSEETPLWQPEKTSKKSKKSASTQNKETSTPSSTQKQPEVDLAPTPTADTPIDFSDIIARTNVELKRLGWTTQQGKEYLLQTYGKRSRQLLTDAELLDFLHYLESVPAPE